MRVRVKKEIVTLGRPDILPHRKTGKYVPPQEWNALIENPDGSFTLRGKDLIEYRFDLSNRLDSVVDEYGNTIAFNYTGDDLTTVVDTSGRTTSFSYDASGRITNILDPIGRTINIRGKPYRIVGTMAERKSIMGSLGENYVVVPWTTYEKDFLDRGMEDRSIAATVAPGYTLDDVRESLVGALRAGRRLLLPRFPPVVRQGNFFPVSPCTLQEFPVPPVDV